jgi:hypothetical protein
MDAYMVDDLRFRVEQAAETTPRRSVDEIEMPPRGSRGVLDPKN